MCGVPFTALLVFSRGFKFLLLLGRSYSNRDFYSRISETPYFPVQVLFALVLGWLLDHSQPHKSVVGLGIPIGNSLPLMHHTCNFRAGGDICACSIAGQAVTFFRLGCRPSRRCFDQVLVTLPFYSCRAYSVGAFLARRNVQPILAASRKLTLAIMSAGLIMQNTGWQWNYWIILPTAVGLGLYLLSVVSTMWRNSVPST
jgi:uncharacterized protein (DUF2062 family)